MRLIFPLAIAGALAVVAWPLVDPTDEPALSFVDAGRVAGTIKFPLQRAAWVGDDEKRNAIIQSAVWAPNGSVEKFKAGHTAFEQRNILP